MGGGKIDRSSNTQHLFLTDPNHAALSRALENMVFDITSDLFGFLVTIDF